MDMPSLWIPSQQVFSLTLLLILPDPTNIAVLFENRDPVTLTQELPRGDKAGSTRSYHCLHV